MKLVVLFALCSLLVNCGMYPATSADGAIQIAPQRSEIVFVDAGVANYGQLLADLQTRHDVHRRFDVYVLDRQQDGIEQISEVLAGYRGVDAIHVLSHGTDGAVQLGNTWLHVDYLDAHAHAVATWRDALSRDADVFFYGCNVVRSQPGRRFIQAVSTLTGADVAASANETGHASLGGDWALEYAVGDIETDIVSSRALQASWMSVLDILTFQEGVAGYTGTIDTFVSSFEPDADNSESVVIDTDNGSPLRHGLIRFDNIFGSGPGQIPLGSTITAASLTVNVTVSSGGAANITLHRMLIPWVETVSWNLMAAGVQADDIEASSVADSVLATPNTTGLVTFDDAGLVTTLQAWSNGDPNDGWAVLNDHSSRWEFSSSEDPTAGWRPLLTVDYTPGITVTNTNNAGPGSLRQAIIDANALGGPATITFNIPLTDLKHYYYRDDGVPGSLSLIAATALDDASISDFDPDYPFTPHSWYTITPNTALPNIASDVTVDATTQPGYAGTPVIELDGSSVGSNVSGLRITGNNSTIRGLVINRFTGHGLWLSGHVSSIESNYIGTDISGTMALGNGMQGIQIDNSDNHTIGGLIPGAGNVISGNTWSGVSIQLGGSSDNVIQGNLIGTDATGTVAIGNGLYGVDIWNGGPSGNLIGGSTPDARNIISGNAWECVQIRGPGATNNTVSGNYMGTDASGMFPIPCGLGGIVVEAGARNNTIGGTIPGSGNLIAFNNGDGVKLEDASTDFNAIQGNHIFSNLGLGIDLHDDGMSANDDGDGDSGANSLQNFPVLTSANTDGAGNFYVGGVINSTPSRTFRIEFFSNVGTDPSGHGEGETYLGFTTVTTDVLGNGAYSTGLGLSVAAGSFITATATDQITNDTSEFSAYVTVLNMNQLVVDTTEDFVDAPDTTSIAALLADRGTDHLISLREAILAVNSTPNSTGPDEIHFHIPDIDPNHFYYQNDSTADSLSLVLPTLLADLSITDFDPDYPGTPHSWYTMSPLSALPDIAEAVIIDGYTQPGAAANTLMVGSDAILRIELDGSAAGVTDGFYINAGGNVIIRGLVINRFQDDGISIRDINNNTIEGNYIGTDITGTLDQGNMKQGINVRNSDSNMIGGSTAASRNIISGNDQHGIILFDNADSNTIAGNYIGTNAAGTASLGNLQDGLNISSATTTIGGVTAAAANVISGNANNGINFNGASTTGNEVYGNAIGTDLSGTLLLGNGDRGIVVRNGARNNTIGGVSAGEANTIAFNTNDGIEVSSDSSDGNTIRGNSIHSNGITASDLGIDLAANGVNSNDLDDIDAGANQEQNYPIITSAVTNETDTVTITGSLTSLITTTFDLDFFYTIAEGGEGQVYLGSVSVSTNGSGTASFNNIPFAPFAVPDAAYITATATVTSGPETGNTSEFSEDFQATNTNNQPPMADAGGPYNIAEGDSVMLDASLSDDPDSNPLTYAWDLNDDAIFGDVTGVSPTLTWAQLQSFNIDDGDDVYQIAVQVDDGQGETDTATTTITVANTAPTLSTTGATSVSRGALYTLNLSANDPGADTITEWTINWGDGAIETIVGNPTAVTHTYARSGFTFNILASAMDEDGTVLQNELIVPSYTLNRLFRYEPTSGDFIQQFATADGLDDPIEAIVGPDGHLYVSGERSDHVLRYDATTGAFIDEFVSAGSGGLDEAGGIAFGADGNLYVASGKGDEVLRYDGTTGAFIDIFVSAGSGGLNQPYPLAFGPDGHLYVASFSDSEVLRYDGTTGAFIDIFVSAGSGGLDTPEQMSFGPDGHLYITSFDTDNVLRFNGTTGAFIDVFVAAGGTEDLDQPTGIAFGPDGHLYVTDYQDALVFRYDGSTGAFIDEYVTAGSGGLASPVFISFHPLHQVYVLSQPPAISLPSGPLGFTEGDLASAIDPGASVSDPDSPDFDGGTLTADFTAGGTTNDRLAIRDQGPGVGNISLSGSDVLYDFGSGPIIIGAFAGGTTGADPLVVTFNANSNETSVGAVLRNVTYQNVVDNPSTDSRIVRFVLTDGDGGTSNGVTQTVDVSAENDVPTATITPASYNVTEGTPLNLHANGLAVADPDAGPNSIRATLSSGEGFLSVNAGGTGVSVSGSGTGIIVLNGTLVELNNLFDGNAGSGITYQTVENPSATTALTLDIDDLGHTGSGGSLTHSDNANLIIAAQNDDPSNIGTLPADVPVIEDTATNIDLSALDLADVDAGSGALTLTLTTSTGGTLTATSSGGVTVGGSGTVNLALDGTLSALNTYLDDSTKIRYLSVLNTAGDNADSLTIDVTDNGNMGSGGGGIILLGSVNVDITPVNDAPVLDNTGTMTLTDVIQDSTNPPGNSVTSIISSAGGNPITDSDSGAVEGIAVIGVDDANGTWEYSTDGGSLWQSFVVNGVANGAIDDTSAVLLDDTELVRFVPNSSYTGPAGDITFHAWDQTSGASGDNGVNASVQGGTSAYSIETETATLSVVALSGVTNLVPGAQTIEEDTALLFSSSNGNVITVEDGSGADPVLQTSLSVTSGTLTLATITGLTFDSGADGTSDMTISGLESAINTALNGLSYDPTGDYHGPETLQVTTGSSGSLLAHYSFDNVADPGNDDSPGGAHDGTVNGGTLPVFDAVRGGNVLPFDGTNDNVHIPGLIGAPSNITLAAWVNMDAGFFEDELISLGDNIFIRLDETFFGDGVVGAFHDGFTWRSTASNLFIAGTGWHHIAYTVDTTNNEQALYLDGMPVATDNYTGSISYGLGTQTYIGRHGTLSSFLFFLHGKVDDVMIFDYPLTAAEIAGLFAGGSGAIGDTDGIAITVTPVGDTPSVTSTSTLEDTQTTSGLVLSRYAADGPEVTHFRISNITGGTLSHTDGSTVITDGTYITFDEGQTGLKFTPTLHSTTPGGFNAESSEDGFTVAAQSGIATATISVTPVGDTPSVTNASTFEDAQTASGLVISRHASDGAEVTHFKITTITGGTLYHTDGVTAISNGDFITVAQGSTGLKFTPAPDSTAPGSFNVESSEDGLTVGAQSGVATATITVTPVGDTPQAASIATFEDTQSGAIVLDRNVNDGTEVTHLRISNIGGGTLYHSDGVTVINAGVYITVAQGNAGLKFTPAPDSTTPGSFNVESSEDSFTVAAQSGVATSTLTIIPVGDTPQAANISTLEDTQSGPIGLDRNSNDGLEVTHLRISNIGGGTLYHNDGVTVINAGDFITVAQGQAGLKFTPTTGFTTPGRFDVESSEDGTTVAAQSGVATATITILTTSGLWLSTEDDVPSPSQVPGLDSWGQDQVLAFDEPNFHLEPGTTDGTLYPVFNLDLFALDGDADVKGVHYVSQDLTVGGAFFPAIDLFTGDLLLIVDASETLDGTGANLLSVTSQDVFVFRPDVAGDYSAGTFLLLLQAPSGEPLNSISLVENLTLVGDVILDKGTFIFSQMNSDDDAIYHFATDDVGTNTSGFVSVLLDGSEFGLDQPVAGLDLIEQSVIVGGTTLQAGTLLVTLENDDGAVGTATPISTTQQDLFALDVTTTHMGSGTSAAAATLLLEGNDVGLNTDAEDLDALTLLATVVNNPPTALNSTISVGEDTSYTFTASDFQFSDLDGGSLALLRIKTAETAGDLELSGADVTAAQVISASDIGAGNLKFTPAPDANGSNYATFEFYVHDGIEYSDNSYTMIIHVAEQADTPSVTPTTTDEDTPSSTGLVLSLNAADGEGVTYFKISAISGGTLYQNDGMTVINAGDFITFAEGDAGLTFTPAANSTANGSFAIQASTANNDMGLGGNTVTATVTVTPVGDTPQAASIVTLEDTPSGPVVLDRHIDDGPEVTHFKITNITGGVLVHADGVTVVNHGDFITVTQGNAGLQFIPSPDSTAMGRFDVESSEDGLTVASQSGIATATISVTPVADTPSVTHASTLEDTPTTSGLVLSRYAADGPEVTHFKITGIVGGTLYQNDGTTAINSGDFITVAQGHAGLTFTPSLNSTAPGRFDVQASTTGLDSGLGGATATAAINVSPVNDGPSATIALSSYAASEGTPLILHGTGLLVGDLDAGASTVRVTLSVGEGSLTVTPGSTGVTVAGSGSASVTFEGTLAEINDVLAGNLDATITYDTSPVTDTVLALTIDDLGAGGAGGPLTATATVTLTIAAAVAGNSGPTALSVSSHAVDENIDTHLGYRIGTLTATDPDSTDALTYTIVGGADANKFSIGGAAANELILTDGRLDHETTSAYDVTVRVIDSGGLALDATFAITVNDLATIITAAQSFSVTATDSDGAVVGTVGTTGDDPITFAITGGDVNNAFAIDANGTITVADSSALNLDTISSYTLTIEASDGTRSVSETVTITVTDAAETSSGGDSSPISSPSSSSEAALIPDATPDVNPETETPEPVSEASSTPTPTPAEDASPEPQESEPETANPRTPNPQTPSPQAPAPRPTQLGTDTSGFIPGRTSVPGQNSGRVNPPAPTAAPLEQQADEEIVPIESPPVEDLRPLDDPRPPIVAEELLQEFDEMRDEIGEEVAFSQVTVGSTLTVATGLSIGYVLWLIRGGLLLSSLLSSLPAWRFIDPLPVLTHLDTSAREEETEDDSLEAVLQKGAEVANAQRESTSRLNVERDV